MIKNCDTCRYEYRSSSEEPCDNCNYPYGNWKEKSEMKPTLEELLKQVADLEEKIEELKNRDIALLVKVKDVLQLYCYRNQRVDPLAKNKSILEQKEEVFVKLPDLLTAIEEGRLKIDENIS